MTQPAQTCDAAATAIGHVHLTVSDLERALTFYREVLAFEVRGRRAGGAYLAMGRYHHHIGLVGPGEGPAAGAIGHCAAAIRYPTRRALAGAARRLTAHGVRITGAADHGVNEALYLTDPDGNCLALSWDRPLRDWPRSADGRIAVVELPLDLDSLLDREL